METKVMLSFLPVVIIFPLAFCAFVLNLTLWGFIVTSCGVLKLLPFAFTRRIASHVAHRAYRQWSVGNKAIMLLFNDVQFQVSPLPELSEQRWYLLIANHQSWLDIPVLTQFALNRVPEPKFFLKEELKWVPFIGSASWALDMPFMRRYSAQQIARNPALKGQDIETTRRSCEKFRDVPTTIINFVEGTRFTREKHQQKQSPFQHLLPPKAGGIAFTLASMGSQFDAVMDVTVVYPDNPRFVALAMLCGRLKRVMINVELLPVDQHIIGEYFTDEAFRQQFQLWLNQRWQHKDQLIQHMLLQAQPQVPVRTWLDRHFSGS
jgi:1-acyl-sn-glycerol-3-phosphate acyltransferase